MLYSYNDCIKLIGSYQKLNEVLEKEEIYTLNIAFYYHGLTDDIPEYYYLATPKNTKKIKDNRWTQYSAYTRVCISLA